jgi:hypothetical protein
VEPGSVESGFLLRGVAPTRRAVIVIRPHQGGPGFKYTIPMAALAKLGPMNKDLDPRGHSENVGLVFSFD